jgi:hypothetical protein
MFKEQALCLTLQSNNDIDDDDEPADEMNPILFLVSALRVATAACVVVRLVQRHYFNTNTRHNVLTAR